jgi:glutathione-independent formaldehyde dehydrogenase
MVPAYQRFDAGDLAVAVDLRLVIEFEWGKCWFKGQRIATGQCNVKAYNRQLRDLIHAGRAKPSFIVSHELKLDQAPDAYQHFDVRDHGWTKVVLHPGS